MSSKKDKPLGGGLPSDSSSSAFISILPDSEVSSAFGLKGFSSLGSKTDPILEIQYPMPWKILAERESFLEKSDKSGSWYARQDSLRLVSLAQGKLTNPIFDRKSESKVPSVKQKSRKSGSLLYWYGILNRVITFFVPEYRENE